MRNNWDYCTLFFPRLASTHHSVSSFVLPNWRQVEKKKGSASPTPFCLFWFCFFPLVQHWGWKTGRERRRGNTTSPNIQMTLPLLAHTLHAGMCAFLALSCVVSVSQAIVLEGTVNSGDSYTLLGRFAFSQTKNLLNRVEFEISRPLAYENFAVGLYFDDWEEFQQYNADSTCIEKIGFATRLVCTTKDKASCPSIPAATYLNPFDNFQAGFDDDGNEIMSGTVAHDFSAPKEVEWIWVTLANCNQRACDGTFPNMSSSLCLTNRAVGGTWLSFSCVVVAPRIQQSMRCSLAEHYVQNHNAQCC